ncbi:hypothetical protein [Kitasatospora mediocidica]|uniref:hypothetical protein n=1 Tax=Kitasatospora mediocidica TaxID=58352 RepID=UPI00056730B5|nr:hypothetical protein [Kitasatospora mediocidica]
MKDQKLALQEQAKRAVRLIEPDGRPTAVVLAVNGPRPWLMSLFGPFGIFLLKTYFVTLTKQSVVVHRGPRVSPQPADLVHVIPRSEAQAVITDVKLGATWSSLRLRNPGTGRSTRLNIYRTSRPELDQLLAAVKNTPHNNI